MKTSKEHQLLKDLVEPGKQIRLRNDITTKEVDAHLGYGGICKSIESASWSYVPNHTRWDEAITIYQVVSYLLFVGCDIIIYDDLSKTLVKKEPKKETNFFADLLAGLYKSEPKFI